MFLTHIDENGMDTPPVLITNATAANRAINIPEFVNISYENFHKITVPAVDHFKYLMLSRDNLINKDPENAKKELHKALKAAPDDDKFQAEVLVMLGWLEEDKDEGLKIMAKAVKKDPDYFGAYFDMAVINLNMGREKTAINLLNRSLKVSPNNPYALGKLAEAYGLSVDKKVRNVKKAIELAKQANELTYYNRKEFLQTLGWILSESGNAKESVGFLMKVVEMHKQDEEYQIAAEVQKEISFIKKGLKFTEIYPNRNKN
jgi:tetratricopeptide (TPR) repeat protein